MSVCDLERNGLLHNALIEAKVQPLLDEMTVIIKLPGSLPSSPRLKQY